MASLLLTTVLLPLAGALVMGGDRQSARRIALLTALAALGCAVALVGAYPGGPQPSAGNEFAATDVAWLGWTSAPIDVRFSIALDGLSLWLFALTALLVVVAVLVSWEAIREQATAFYRLLLLLETGMLGVFVARDIVLFYVFFEFTLIPLFFLIGIWGSEQRRHAAVKFFLFTLAGRVLTFLGLLAIVLWDFSHPPGDPAAWRMTFSIPELTAHLAARPIDAQVQVWIFLALFAGFAIKVPLFPLHTWLPLAHVQAPTAGSVILAGVLLKVGTYGFVRFNLPMLPDAAAALMPWLLWLSVAGILYGALVALARGVAAGQLDLRWASSPPTAWARRAACCRWSTTGCRPAACSPWWACSTNATTRGRSPTWADWPAGRPSSRSSCSCSRCRASVCRASTALPASS